MIASDLDSFIAILAFHLAHTTAQSLDQAQHFVRSLIDQGRHDCRTASAPHGDDDAGFLRWIDEHWPTTPTA